MAAVVIGAGPAGIAAVGNLLERLPKEAGQIVWIDKFGFRGGAIHRFPRVPRYVKRRWREVESSKSREGGE